jgi:hypothetical protein
MLTSSFSYYSHQKGEQKKAGRLLRNEWSIFHHRNKNPLFLPRLSLSHVLPLYITSLEKLLLSGQAGETRESWKSQRSFAYRTELQRNVLSRCFSPRISWWKHGFDLGLFQVKFVVDTANSVSTSLNNYTNVPRLSSTPRYSYERKERAKPGTHHRNALPDIRSTGKKGYFHFSDFKGFKKSHAFRPINFLHCTITNK